MINEQATAGECVVLPVFSQNEASTFARMLMAYFQEPGVEEDYQKWLKERQSKG